MKCKKCGAEIPKGKLYCNVCGAEVQLVPDYNFLEDDMLSDIIQNGAGKNITSSKHNAASQTTDPVSSKKKSPAEKKESIHHQRHLSGACYCGTYSFFCLSGYTEETSEQLFLSV